MVILGEDGYNLHLQFTPELANDWKNAMLASVEVPYLLQRVMTSMNASQLESKIWLVQTLKALDNKPLVEIPQNSKIDWMVSAKDMKQIIDIHSKQSLKGRPSAVCLAIHESSAHEHFNKYNEVLSYVDNLIKGESKVKVRYATVNTVRNKFLEYWEKND